MNYTDRVLDFLESQTDWGYNAAGSGAAEPAALTALALAAYGRWQGAERARAWLAEAQGPDGSVGIRHGEATPGWPTACAVLAWNLADPVHNADSPTGHISNVEIGASAHDRDAEASRRAVDWLLSIEGDTSEQPQYTGHDTTLAGWPWVRGTHSWVEPTAMAVLALKCVGLGEHPRVVEAGRLLEDRLLKSGGCNYGNTIVLGQTLLPHVEPTGVALLALAGKADPSGHVKQSIAYLESVLGSQTTSASLAYGLLGLAAHSRIPLEADAWLAACAARSLRRSSSFELALVALAALKTRCPLVSLSTDHQPV